MKISPVAFCFTTPPLRPVAKHFSSSWLYRLCRFNTALSMRYSSHQKRFLRSIQLILSDHVSPERLSEVCRNYLIQRKYLNYLEATWNFMDRGQRPGVIIKGTDYLQEALSKGTGAVLISGHSYGFSRMIGPILAEEGYKIFRAGSLSMDIVRRRWGAEVPWEYVYFPKDPWGRVRALRQLTAALKRNCIIHLLIVNRRSGDNRAKMDFYGRNFFLDFNVFELVSELSAPVLPCFALCNKEGSLDIQIHPPLNSTTDALATGFSRLFSWYLKEFPEYVRFWKPILNHKEFW